MAAETVYVGMYFEDWATAETWDTEEEAQAFCSGVYQGAGEYGAGAVYAMLESEIDEELDESKYDIDIKKALKKAIKHLKKENAE